MKTACFPVRRFERPFRPIEQDLPGPFPDIPGASARFAASVHLLFYLLLTKDWFESEICHRLSRGSLALVTPCFFWIKQCIQVDSHRFNDFLLKSLNVLPINHSIALLMTRFSSDFCYILRVEAEMGSVARAFASFYCLCCSNLRLNLHC